LISNAEGMRQAFDCIGNVLHSMLDEITAISLDVDRKTNILQSFINELFLIFDVTPTHTPAGSYGLPEDFFTHVSYFYTYFTLRYTSAAFLNWIKGNRPLAIKQLSKTKKMTGYERRLLRLWNTEAAIELPDLSAIHKNAGSYNKIGVEKTSFKEFSTLLLSWIPLSIGTSLIYGAFYFSLMLIESRASVYLMGPENNLPFCICCGFITALGISYFTRFHFYRRLHKKDYERYCEMNYIQNGGGEDKLMKGFLCVLFAIGVCGCILFSRWNINFLSDGFIDNTSFFSLRGEYHSYSEVERVYYKPDRINGLGETIEYPSYVLVLTDGNEIDFYEYDGIENYEDDLLAFLREKGIPIDP
ncbi:MAG: hypothetical protein IJA58_03740, partial [Lachnospiraceae bacterium]|nr:hypothetical protein [Lachnospiraceae bacterium]